MEAPYDSRPDTHEHIANVRALLLGAAGDLTRRAHVHDRSKLADPERATFDEFTPKLKASTYGSEEYEGFRRAMGGALEHHYAANDHHPEHHGDGVEGMTLLQVLEMLCDWIAACRRHDDGDIHRSIEINGARFGYGPELAGLLHRTVDELLARELAL